MSRSRLANLLVAAAVGAVFLAGLFSHGAVAAVLLVAVAALLAYLSWQAWATIPGRARPLRVAIVIVVLVIAATKLASS